MKTVKIKFVGKYAEDLQPKDNAITYYLQKNGYDVQISDDADYIICDVFDPKYDYCKYPQIRIFECGENYVPDFNLIDYAVCRYPVSFGDRCFYQPGCTYPGAHWYALAEKKRDYDMDFVHKKEYFANLITSHDSEHQYRSHFFEILNMYKRVESPGTFMNNRPGESVSWNDDTKTSFQSKCKFTICFESTSHYGSITEKITDAFYSDTIPIYFGSANITDFFNSAAFINVADFDSLESVVEKVKELDQDDEKYLAMLRQPILKDPNLPWEIDSALETFILHIFDQPYEKAYRRCRAFYPKWYDEYLSRAVDTEDLTMKDLLVRIADKIKKKVIR